MKALNDVRKFDDEAIYALALTEVDAGNARPGLWAMALAEAAGDEQKARALYIKLRVESERQKQDQSFASEASEAALHGVRGWLLLLAVLLTIVGPILTLIGVASDMGTAERLGGQFPGLETALEINAFVALLFAIYSAYAGWGLWTKRPRAVSTAKEFLIAVLVANILMPILVLMVADLPDREFFAVSFDGIARAIGIAVWVAIWYSYLRRSKRVRATYAS